LDNNNNNIRAGFTTLLRNKVALDETINIFINVTPDIACRNTLAMQRDTLVPDPHDPYVKVVDISYNSNRLIAWDFFNDPPSIYIVCICI